MPFQRQGQVVDARRSEDHFQQLQQPTALQLGVFRPAGYQVVQIGGIGAQQPAALAVCDGDVEHGRGIANGRTQQFCHRGIGAQRLRHRGAQSFGVIGTEIRQTSLGCQRYLVGHHVVGGVSLGHALAQKLAQEDPRQGEYHQEYQPGDREHELGLQSHGAVTRTVFIDFPAIGNRYLSQWLRQKY